MTDDLKDFEADPFAIRLMDAAQILGAIAVSILGVAAIALILMSLERA